MLESSSSVFALLSMLVMVSLGAGGACAQSKTVAERLGYAADAKLLILHADDLAVAHSVNVASFAALDQHAVSSASVMVPCPWLTEVAEYAKAHPDADLGLHLTLTSEWKTYRWGSVASHDQVLSLLAPDGYFYADTVPAATHATPGDVEREIRAQVERAIALGIHPTHLDSHMGTLFARPELFAVFVKVAHSYRLPFLAVRVKDERAKMLSMLSPQDIVLDSLDMTERRPSEDWMAYYVRAVKALTPGVHEIIVHLGHDDAELQAVTVGHPDFGAAWRERDFTVVTSPEFKKALEDNHVILIGWKDLKKLLE
jgi:chitin disaccharide deacetylase